jgi:hypothetical protein
VNLVRIKLKLRHFRMTGNDALGKCFGEGFDGIAKVQSAEWRRDLERAFSHPIDGVAPGTIVLRKRLAALFGRRGGQGWTHDEESKTNLVQVYFHFAHQLFIGEQLSARENLDAWNHQPDSNTGDSNGRRPL